MRRIIALLVVCSLAGLCGCGEGVPAPEYPTEPTTTIEAITLDPNRTKAAMEPVQGGPMLYTFPAYSAYKPTENLYGLINQEGEVIAEQQYSYIQYIYDDAARTRVIGLLAEEAGDNWHGTYTYYSLDGTAKELNCGEVYKASIAPGGRYAVVDTKQNYDDSGREGLFDIGVNAWAVEPKENQGVADYGDAALVNNQDGIWIFNYATGELKRLPIDLSHVGYCTSYIPDVQWFCFFDDGVYRWYDASFNHMPQLDNWRIYPFNGKYAHMYVDGSPVTSAWVDRNGEIVKHVEGPVNYYYSDPLFCYLVNKNNRWDDNLLLDADLNTVFEGNIIAFDGPIKGYVLLDEQQRVKASCDIHGKPLPIDDTPYVLHSPSGYLFRLQNGVWRGPPVLISFGLRYNYHIDGSTGKFVGAGIVEAYEDYILISGWQGLAKKKQKTYIEPSLMAIDWDSNPYLDSPLEPFYGCVMFVDDDFFGEYQWRTAGEQGPSYYWIETEEKRGYINTKGEWLFVDES